MTTAFSDMNIHEYQAKQLLAQYGVAVPPGDVCDQPEQAKALAEKLFAAGNTLVVSDTFNHRIRAVRLY